MDTRHTAAERAADAKAVKDEAAQDSAMRQAAAITARDAKKEDKPVTTFRGKEIVTKEEADAIVLEEKLEAAKAEVGDDAVWYLLTKILKGDQILRLLAQAAGAKARAEEVDFNFEGQPYRFAPKETFKDDDNSARARAYRAHVEAAPAKGEARFTPEPVPEDETAEHKKARLERDRVRKASEAREVAAVPEPVVKNRYILDSIVAWTQSSNRP